MSKKRKEKKGLNKKIFLVILLILICITIILFIHNSNSKSTSNLEAYIECVQNNISIPLENNVFFNNDTSINFTWNINEEGTLTYPNNKTKKISKNVSLNQPGTYIIKVGKTTKKFTIIEEKIDNYISFDESNNTVKFNNINNIISIDIDNNLFNDNIPKEYTFKTKGRYNVTIQTVTGKILSESYRISSNIN